MSVTAASGFEASAVAAGIKPEGLDFGLIAARRAVPAAAVFTQSQTAAPPVEVSRERIASGRARAVVLNSGAANAGTGASGRQDAEEVAASVATGLRCDPTEVLVCSTGPIGGRLPVAAMTAAVPGLVAGLSGEGADDLAESILTTDTVSKQASMHRGSITVGGMAKGAGMLRPDMATMLAVLTTDAEIDASSMSRILRRAVDVTFNCLNVDGCQSTNDTVVFMASGEAGPIDEAALERMVEAVCQSLTRMLATDAEGASRVVDIEVDGAASDEDARRIGRTIADSALVRSSFWGSDPNWGRVLAAAGVAGVVIDQRDITIAYQGVTVCQGGRGVAFHEASVVDALGSDFTVEITVGRGPGQARVVTTDLTPEYVRFNGERS